MKIDSISSNGLSNAVGTKMTMTKSTVNTKDNIQNSSTHINNTQEIELKHKSELTLNEKQWMDIISKANKALEGPHTSVEFSIHDKTKEIMVKVIDKETNKVLREFPPEKILDLVAKMWEMAGIIVDERR